MIRPLSLLVLFFIIGLVSCAGTFDKISDDQLRFERVIVTKTDPALVYERSLQWIALNFKSSKSVIEYQSKEEGKIIGNGVTTFHQAITDYPTSFTMQIDIKDGRFKVLFDNISQAGGYQIYGTSSLQQLHSKFELMCSSLSKAIESTDSKEW